MTFPAGRYPNSGEIGNSFVPSKSLAFTGGGADVDLTDPANKLNPGAREFLCTSGGNLVAVLAGDTPFDGSATQTYPLNAGDVVYGFFVLVKGSSTANGLLRS